MKLVPGNLNIWMALMIILATIAINLGAIYVMAYPNSKGIPLFAISVIAITTLFSLLILLRSLKGNQGKDEFNEVKLRAEEVVSLNTAKNSEPSLAKK